MSSGRTRTAGILLGLATALSGSTVQATPDARGLTLKRTGDGSVKQGADAVLDQVDIDQKLDQSLPLDLPFRDAFGQDVTLGRYFKGNKPVVLALVYYECPMLCTMVLNGALRAFNTVSEMSVGRDYDVVAISIDPRETPELALQKQQKYQSRYRREGSKNGWHFLVGDEASVERIADAVGFSFVYDEENDQWAHPSAIMVVTPEGKLSKYLLGIDYDPRELRAALVAASEGSIGTLVDRVILYCFNYNPLEGKYSLAVMRLMRTGGVLTVLGILAYVLFSGLRGRRLKERTS